MRGPRGIGLTAGLSVLLMLVVVAASAQIRAAAGIDVQPVRTLHRVCASSVALLVSALMLFAWRQSRLRLTAGAAFALMLALSAVGWITGMTPPPAAAFFNQFGGLALTALLACIWARESGMATSAVDGNRALASIALLLAVAQAGFGSALAAFTEQPAVLVLILHAACGVAAAALVAALRHPAALACALVAPAAGLAMALLDTRTLAPVAHALSAALLLVAAGAARGMPSPRA